MVFWAPLHPRKVYVEAEPSVPVKVTLFGSTLCRCNQVRVRLSGNSLNQYPSKKRQTPRGDRDTGACRVITETGIGVMQLKPRRAKEWWPTPEAGKKQRRIPCYRLQREQVPADTLIFYCSPPELRGNTYLWEAPNLWCFVLAAWGNSNR